MIKWTDEQKKAIETTDGIVCLSAGPGCGKTFVLVNRYFNILQKLVAKGYSIDEAASRILAVTFTNKATSEMKDRIAKNLASFEYNGTVLSEQDIERIMQKMRIYTIDAWANSFLRENLLATNLKLSPDFELKFNIFAKENFVNLAVKIFDGYSKDTAKMENLDLHIRPTVLFKKIYSFIQSLKARLVSADEFLMTTKRAFADGKTDDIICNLAEFIAELYRNFDEWMLKNSYLTFADYLVFVRQIFVEYPDLLDEYAKEIDYILVDEYQDINEAQDMVLRMLSCGISSVENCNDNNENYFIVGDVGQSIYGFRYANYRLMLEYKTRKSDFSLELSKNFRSTKNIVDFTNTYFCRRNQKEQNIYQKLEANNQDSGEKIGLIFSETREEDARKIAGKIKEILDEKKYKSGDIKILFKQMTDVWKYAAELDRFNIQFVIIGGSEFGRRKEVGFFLSIFRLLANPFDDEANAVLLTHPIFGFEFYELAVLKNLTENKTGNLLQTLRECLVVGNVVETRLIASLQSSDIKQKIRRYLDFVDRFFNLSFERKLADIFDAALKETGYLKYMRTLPREQYLKNIDSIEKFKTIIDIYERENIFYTINGFVKYFDDLRDDDFSVFVDETGTDVEAVVLMTIHKSKGLEFPVVFLGGMKNSANRQADFHFDKDKGLVVKYSNSQILKEKNRRDYYAEFLEEKNKYEHIEEEERKFYVGVTRAKEMLFISALSDGKSKKFGEFVNRIVETTNLGAFETPFEKFVVKDEFRALVDIVETTNLGISCSENSRFVITDENAGTLTFSANTSRKELKFYDDVDFKTEGRRKYFYSVSELAFYKKNGYFKDENDVDGFNEEFEDEKIDLSDDKNKINHLAFGSFVHDFLETNFSSFSAIDAKSNILYLCFRKNDNFVQLLDTRLIASLQEYGLICNKEYIGKIKKLASWLINLDIEAEKNKILYLEKNFVWKAGDVFVRGTIDRIDNIADGKVAIIDYKTSEKIVAGEYDFAMNIYAAAFEEIFGLEVGEIKLVYPLLGKEALVDRIATEKIKDEVEKIIKAKL